MPINVLAVRIDQIWIALLAESVQEVIGERPWVAIVGAPAELPGAVSWRGRAIALLDLGQLIAGGKPLGVGEGRPRMLVVEANGCVLGLPVDGVREVRQVLDANVRAPSATRQRFSEQEIELDGLPLPLLDLGAIVDSFSRAPARA